VRYFWVKPSDVAIYVERGAADVGVCGKDILLEYYPDLYELLDLGIGKCRMCVAGPKDFYDNEERTLRVATKFSNVARTYYESIGRDIDIIKLNGSIEIAPLLGLSDVIFDIVETGGTLRENNLEVLQEVVPVSARLVCNKVSYQFKHEEIIRLRDGLGNIVKSGEKVETIKLEH
jgi:ATP phosphoribosyltransferase/ATP phosphoribosyltransferase regulatory subunit